jgi:hypothetical protein
MKAPVPQMRYGRFPFPFFILFIMRINTELRKREYNRKNICWRYPMLRKFLSHIIFIHALVALGILALWGFIERSRLSLRSYARSLFQAPFVGP